MTVRTEEASYEWKRIKPIQKKDRDNTSKSMKSIYETWRLSKARMKERSASGLEEFNRKLVRRLSIESGIIERLYDLDRGTTEALVEHGFREDLISRSSTDIEPSRLVDILKDQEAAITLVLDCIAGNRDLSKGLMHELQSILTNHQHFTEGVDQFGNKTRIKLEKGKFKEFPNNPRREDGKIHQYCPPIHVESEIDSLISYYNEYSSNTDDAVLLAAWLHHRFTQIHPYQDGNGRTVRALTTLVLLKNDLLPIVIDRDHRNEYITALEYADNEDLSKLVSLFERLERNAITQALSIDADAALAHHKSITSSVLESLAGKFNRRKLDQQAELRVVNSLAINLRSIIESRNNSMFEALVETLNTLGDVVHFSTLGGPDQENAHWYKHDVIKTAQENKSFVNFSEDHYFVKNTVKVENERLVFVVSLHHIGRELSGMMEATAFARIESYNESESQDLSSKEFFICSLEPFIFTNRTDSESIKETFEAWLDHSTAIAFKEFGDRL